jgi:uncharacterized protein (DUF1778 family)
MNIFEKNTDRISARISKTMRKQIEKKAKSLNINVSQFVKLALIEKINNDKN